MRSAADQPTAGRRLTVQEAAEVLGVTVDAVRGRIKRGTLSSAKDDEDGTVYVFLDGDDQPANESGASHQPDADQPELVAALREQIDHLRRQLDEANRANAEHRRLLAAALERIPPQLEAPSEAPEEPRDGHERGSEESGRGEGRAEQERPSERPWWRRLLGM